MAAVLSLLIIVTVSILVNKVATVALTHTGLSQESARFQARSAFTGVGFTTSESEQVVNHPVRRRILMLLMLFGHAGFVTVISSLILTFISPKTSSVDWVVRLLVLASGLTILWVLATSDWINHWLSRVIGWALKRWTRLDVRDYASLLRLSGEYEVSEMAVEAGDWLADKTLAQLSLRERSVMVLGIQRRDGTYVGAPDGQTKILPGDVLILYGLEPAIQNLDERQPPP